MDQNEFTTLGEWQGYSKERVAALLMMDQRDRLLLQFRDPFPHIAHPGRWSLFGGHVEGNEDLRETCGREINEELGIDLDLQGLIPFARFVVIPLNWWIRFMFLQRASAFRSAKFHLGKAQALEYSPLCS